MTIGGGGPSAGRYEFVSVITTTLWRVLREELRRVPGSSRFSEAGRKPVGRYG